jgi:hypothetical protein
MRDKFDQVIGQLDRVLSEFLCLYNSELDEPDRQTLKHHADNLIGVGRKMHSELQKTAKPPMSAERKEIMCGNCGLQHEYESARRECQYCGQSCCFVCVDKHERKCE